MLELIIYKSIVVGSLQFKTPILQVRLYGHLRDRHHYDRGAFGGEDRRYSESSAVEKLQNL
ncbi:hypothetical protein [Nostoc sp. ChiSLP03a]|uniref:hypothetical protein n=1 Tax=Nostoc sp. ChiSLP03a TaxID=3075380 RepID=UPI002AD52B04|nr:hypothetical protein [Nostoc sp. ChiSLP03a]MDZ8209632.1 hypothetical protein [Nostoc sp. ChiSLP03a]